MEREKNRNNWLELIEQQKKSGLSQVEWCKEKGVNIYTFRSWVSKFNKEQNSSDSTSSWAKLQVTENSTIETYSLVRVEIGDAVIEISESFNIQTFEKIVSVLKKYV